MDNFDNKNLKTSRRTAPEGMYGQVRERIIQERIKMATTRRQLAIGSALLLIVGIVNVSIIFYYSGEKQEVVTNNTEKTLYETYFDNQSPLPK